MKYSFSRFANSMLLLGIVTISCSRVDNKRNDHVYVEPAWQVGKESQKVSFHPKKLYIHSSSDHKSGNLYVCDTTNNQKSEPLNLDHCFRKDNQALDPVKETTYLAGGSNIVIAKDHVYIGSQKIISDQSLQNITENMFSSVIKCTLGLEKCSYAKINSDIGDGTGASLAVFNNNLYIGAPYANFDPNIQKKSISKISSNFPSKNALKINIKPIQNSLKTPFIPQGFGAVYRCNLDDLEQCDTINYPKENYNSLSSKKIQPVNFGKGLFVNKNGLFVVAQFEQNTKSSPIDLGALYKCELNSNKCQEIELSFKDKSLNMKIFNLDQSILVTERFIFAQIRFNDLIKPIKFKNLKFHVIKCELNGKNCEFIEEPTDTIENIYYGKSLVTDGTNIFVGSPALKNKKLNIFGRVYKCDLEGKNCSLFIESKNERRFGESLYLR